MAHILLALSILRILHCYSLLGIVMQTRLALLTANLLVVLCFSMLVVLYLGQLSSSGLWHTVQLSQSMWCCQWLGVSVCGFVSYMQKSMVPV